MKKASLIHFLNVIVFALTLSLVGFLFLASSPQEFSMVEKRKLAQLPQFSKDSLFEGKYLKRVDFYVADHFPGREGLVEFAFFLKSVKGFKVQQETVYSPKPKKKKRKVKLFAMQESPDEEIIDEDAEESHGIVITRGRALQVFSGSDTRAKKYAAVINGYYKELKGISNVYNIVVPSAGEFYLPTKYKKYYDKERKNIDTIYKNLSAGIKPVDAYSNLKKHRKEYIYFKTDHHWTGLGAFYAYEAYCKKAGIKVLPLAKMQKKTLYDFYGSLYTLTHDPDLKANVDTVHYWVVPTQYSVLTRTRKNQQKEIKGRVYVEQAGGYCVYLGADHPLIKVETENKNGKSVLVVKNSYGNPFATYLIPHYEKVYILDYRYFNPGVVDLVKENKITDVIFINGSISANTTSHIERLRKVMLKNKSQRKKDKEPA